MSFYAYIALYLSYQKVIHLNPFVYDLRSEALTTVQTLLLEPVVYNEQLPALSVLSGYRIGLHPVVYQLRAPVLSLLRIVLLNPVRYTLKQPAMSNAQGANLKPV